VGLVGVSRLATTEGTGLAMTDNAPAGDAPGEGHRPFAVAAFNACWALIDNPARTPEQDRQMLTLAFASRWHWGEAGNDENIAVSDWQIAHAASLLGDGPLALWFAHAALERADSAGLPQWLRASANEGVARAYAAAGDRDGYERHAAQARELLASLDDAEDRALIESQLASITPPA
jgi:hypothetical protein